MKPWHSLVPFSYLNTLQSAVGKSINTVLDVGCGDGELIDIVRGNKDWEITGVDAYRSPSIRPDIFTEFIQEDVTNMSWRVTSSKYDLVFCSMLIEHLDKKDAMKLILLLESLYIKRLVITTMVGFYEFKHLNDIDEKNALQVHKSGWAPCELEGLGFKVRGQGLRSVWHPDGWIYNIDRKCRPLLNFISMCASPVVYLNPSFGVGQIASK